MWNHAQEGPKLEIGDEDPRKVNPSPPDGDELPQDPGANHPETPDISEGLVCDEQTIPIIINKVFSELIFYYKTNINLKELEEKYPELVCRQKTILRRELGGDIAQRIHEAQVFTTPTIILSLNLPYMQAKPYVYQIKKALEIEGIVERTPYKAIHPNPKYPGPRPHFYRLTNIELNGWSDPLLKKAQKDYEEAQLKYDPLTRREKSASERLIKISLEATYYYLDYYRTRLRVGKHQAPDQSEIMKLVKSDYPELDAKTRVNIVSQVHKILYMEKDDQPPLEAVPRVAEEGE